MSSKVGHSNAPKGHPRRPKGRAPKKTPSTPREFPSPPEEAGRESRSGQGGHRGQMGLGGQGGGAGAKAGWAAPAAGAPRAPARAYQRGQGCCYMTPSSCKRGWHGTASFVARKRACPKRRSDSFFKSVLNGFLEKLNKNVKKTF